MKKKIGFWFDYDQTYSFTKVFNEMLGLDSNLIATGFIINDRYFDYASKNLKKYSNLISFYNVLEQNMHKFPSDNAIDKFLYYDHKYGLTKVMYSDRWLKKLNNKIGFKKIKFLFANLIEYFENYIVNEQIKVFIFNCVASAWSHLFYFVLKEKKVKIIIPTITGVENRIFLSDNPYEYFRDAYNYYNKLNSERNGKVDEKIEKHSKEIIKKIRNYEPAYKNRAEILEKDKFQIPSVKRIISYIFNYYKYYKNDYTQLSIIEKFTNIIKLKYNTKKTSHFFSKISDIDTPFIYFPLHYEPEIATLILSQYDQLAIIDIISKQIPLNWMLIIKEHPAMVGQRDYKFYKIIKEKYPNVLIIDSNENSRVLIEKSEIVFSLCGTVIFESIVLKKPVIYTGRVRYEGFKLGIHSKDILNFENLLDKALNYKYDDKKIENMVISILDNSYDFIFAEPLGTPEVLEKENIKKIAKAFYEKISFYK